jgi:NurA-like 5'-3' nuclease
MWLYIWASRRRGELRWEKFVERYYKFLPEDVVLICDSHHAEIHSIYDTIINEDRASTRISFSKYSWTQAERLMEKLTQVCNEWLTKVTPGIDSETFRDTREVYKSVLKKQARRQNSRRGRA